MSQGGHQITSSANRKTNITAHAHCVNQNTQLIYTNKTIKLSCTPYYHQTFVLEAWPVHTHSVRQFMNNGEGPCNIHGYNIVELVATVFK